MCLMRACCVQIVSLASAYLSCLASKKKNLGAMRIQSNLEHYLGTMMQRLVCICCMLQLDVRLTMDKGCGVVPLYAAGVWGRRLMTTRWCRMFSRRLHSGKLPQISK